MSNTFSSCPFCFGNINIVFLLNNCELDTISISCFFCETKINCIKIIMKTNKWINIQEKIIDKADQSGFINFFQRWTKRKKLRLGSKKCQR